MIYVVTGAVKGVIAERWSSTWSTWPAKSGSAGPSICPAGNCTDTPTDAIRPAHGFRVHWVVVIDTDTQLPRRQRWMLGTLVYRFPQVHLGIGLLGNALFVVGAILVMFNHQGTRDLVLPRRQLRHARREPRGAGSPTRNCPPITRRRIARHNPSVPSPGPMPSPPSHVPEAPRSAQPVRVHRGAAECPASCPHSTRARWAKASLSWPTPRADGGAVAVSAGLVLSGAGAWSVGVRCHSGRCRVVAREMAPAVASSAAAARRHRECRTASALPMARSPAHGVDGWPAPTAASSSFKRLAGVVRTTARISSSGPVRSGARNSGTSAMRGHPTQQGTCRGGQAGAGGSAQRAEPARRALDGLDAAGDLTMGTAR